MECAPKKKNSEPFIGMNVKAGTVRFNKPAIDALKINSGDEVVFHQDEDEPGDWYMQVINNNIPEGKESTHNPKGFILRKGKATVPDLTFNNTSMVRAIFDSVEYASNSGKIKIGEPINEKGIGMLWTLITASLINK